MQWTLTEALDLSFFSCQSVNVSLAVVNGNGTSQFIPPIDVCIHGGLYNILIYLLISGASKLELEAELSQWYVRISTK